MKKLLLCMTTFIFVSSCNIFSINPNSNQLKIPVVKADYDISKAPEPKILAFSSKAVNKNIESVFKLPEGKELKIELTTEKDNDKEKIKIPKTGDFKIIFEKLLSKRKESSEKAKITDNDATDGTATVQMPETFMEGFLKLQDEGESKSINTLTIEDKLYFSMNDLSVMSPNKSKESEKSKDKKDDDKDKWFRIGKRAFPVPSNWYSDDGNSYILRFKNNGIKKGEFRWFKTNKADFPMNINEITPENGGKINFLGVGSLEVPEGAVNKNTVIVMKQELQVQEIIRINTGGGDMPEQIAMDFISPVVRLEPFGMVLNKDAVIYLETDLQRLGKNDPFVIEWKSSVDKIKWEKMPYLPDQPVNELKPDYPAPIHKLKYISKQIDSYTKPTNSYKLYIDYQLPSNGFTAQATYDDNENFFITYDDPTSLDRVVSRLEGAYTYFKSKTNFEPYHTQYSRTINGKKEYMYRIPVKIDENRDFSEEPMPTKLTEEEIADLKNPAHPQSSSLVNESKIIIGNKSKNNNTGKAELAVEHELWHVFQYARTTPVHDWTIESSATHMGGRAFEKFGKKLYNKVQDDEDGYIRYLNYNVTSLSNSETLIPEKDLDILADGRVIDYGLYKRVGYFTFLANKNTFTTSEENNDSEIINITPDYLHLELFHDYAIYSYTAERFDILNPLKSPNFFGIRISDNKTFTLTDQNKIALTESKDATPLKIPSTKNLVNYSADYIKIVPNVTNGIKMLGIFVNSGTCENSIQVSAIMYYGNKNYVRRDLDLPNKSWNTISLNPPPGGISTASPTEIILVITNSSGKLTDSSSCGYNLKVGYLCKTMGISSVKTGGCR